LTPGASRQASAPAHIAAFLSEHSPFDALARAEVERLAAAVQVEFHRAGEPIPDPVAATSPARIVRAGALEVHHDGRMLARVGAGGVLGRGSGLPEGCAARAAEDTLCYRIAPDEGGQAPPRARPRPGRWSWRRWPWREAEWCALDFELTGLDLQADDVVSFGAVPIVDGRVQLSGAVAGLVRPRVAITATASRVHGLSAADLEHAPPLREAIEPLLGAIEGRGLVAHTAVIERTFLRRALAEHGLRLANPIADTEELGRLWLHTRERRLRPRLGLAELAAALGLPAERPHDALCDALTTAQVFVALAAHLEALRPETAGSLTRAARRVQALRVFRMG
jgi:DNA polymerase-3 subunit epsilon